MYYGQEVVDAIPLYRGKAASKKSRRKARMAKKRALRSMARHRGLGKKASAQALQFAAQAPTRKDQVRRVLAKINSLSLKDLLLLLKTTKNTVVKRAVKARIAQLERQQKRMATVSSRLGALAITPMGALDFTLPTSPFGALSEDGLLVYNGLGGAHGGDYEYNGMFYERAVSNLPIVLGVYGVGALMLASKMKKKGKQKKAKQYLNISGIIAVGLLVDHYLFPSDVTVIEKIEEVTATSGLLPGLG